MLLANLAGITLADFEALRSLGLIEQVGAGQSRASAPTQARQASPAPGPTPAPAPAPAASVGTPPDPLSYASFTAALTQLISKELGLRGFALSLAVEKASTGEELQAVAKRAVDQIRERKGEAAAAAARIALYGG